MRNLAGSVLVVLQVAIALAVLSNAAWIVQQRMEIVNKPTGIDDQNISAISSAPVNQQFNYQASVGEDLAYLRSLAGVRAASLTDAAPFSRTGFAADVWMNPDHKGKPESLNAFSMDEQGLNALGAHLIAGREFRADEIAPPLSARNVSEFVPEVIITKAAADSLFPGQNALGKIVYDSLGKPAAIIGVVANMIGSVPHGMGNAEHVALYPRLPPAEKVIYLVRTEPGRRDEILAAAEAHLGTINPNRVIKYARPLEQFKGRLYLADSNMEIFLGTAAALVLLSTCLGLYGLATFNVSARTRQMGTRRALGARKRDILQYYLVESALLTTAGLVLGCALALAASYWLSSQYALAPLNRYFLIGSVPLLWVIGLLAVWYPARKASSMPPSAAIHAA
jgi:putative ABC transport system permease protein